MERAASARPDKIFRWQCTGSGIPADWLAPPAVRFLTVRPAARSPYRRVSVRGISACRRQKGAGMLSLPLITKSYFPAVPCRLLYHLPQQRRDAAAHGPDIIRRKDTCSAQPLSLPAGLEAARRSMCPGCSRRLRQDTSQPQGRFSRLQGYRTRHARAVYAARRQGKSGPLPFAQQLTLHQSLMMVRQGPF